MLIKKDTFVLIAFEILCIIGFLLFPKRIVYTNFFMYLVLVIYYRKGFSFKTLKEKITSGKHYWKLVLYTLIGIFFSLVLVFAVKNIFFSEVEDGLFKIKTHNNFEFILYIIQVIFLPAIAEELFFRKEIINFSSKKYLVITSLLSLLLFASAHGLSYLAIIGVSIVGLPLTISYIKTKDIYVVIVAHFILDLVGNMPSIIMFFTKRW